MVNEQVYELIYHLHFYLDVLLQEGYHLKTTDGAVLTRIDQVDRALQAGNLATPPIACLASLVEMSPIGDIGAETQNFASLLLAEASYA